MSWKGECFAMHAGMRVTRTRGERERQRTRMNTTQRPMKADLRCESSQLQPLPRTLGVAGMSHELVSSVVAERIETSIAV